MEPGQKQKEFPKIAETKGQYAKISSGPSEFAVGWDIIGSAMRRCLIVQRINKVKVQGAEDNKNDQIHIYPTAVPSMPSVLHFLASAFKLQNLGSTV